MKELFDTINSKVNGNRVVEIAGDPVRLTRYLVRLMKDERVPRSAKLKLLASGLYAWIDGDLVPDPIRMIPGLGYVDDVILVVHGIKCLISETESHVAVELWPGDQESFRRVMSAVAWLDNQLFERARGWIKSLVDKVAGEPRQAAGDKAKF